MKPTKTLAIWIAAASTFYAVGSAQAAYLPVYDGPSINWNSSACLGIGDAYGCSLPLLNYFAGISPTTTETPSGYLIKSPQGDSGLANYIVLQGGGAAPNNTVPYGAGASVENGFKSNDGGSDSFRATGKTSTVIGNMNDPDNNGLTSSADLAGTWDVGLGWLINALSPNGVRRELMIGFDYNQPQNTTTSLNYWALITVRDVDGSKSDVNYEIRSDTGISPLTWSTSKTIDSKPFASDFSTVNGITCVDTNGSQAIAILPQPGGSCPPGYEISIDNAKATDSTEIVAFMPELNEGLEGFLADGYDTISVRMLFGCFGGTPRGSFNPGIGYLEGSGATNQCESGGYGDVFLIVGAPEHQVPEPGSLVLMALALLGIGFGSKRFARHL